MSDRVVTILACLAVFLTPLVLLTLAFLVISFVSWSWLVFPIEAFRASLVVGAFLLVCFADFIKEGYKQ